MNRRAAVGGSTAGERQRRGLLGGGQPWRGPGVRDRGRPGGKVHPGYVMWHTAPPPAPARVRDENGPATYDDARAVAVSGSTVYVTGEPRYATLAIAPHGAQLWPARDSETLLAAVPVSPGGSRVYGRGDRLLPERLRYGGASRWLSVCGGVAGMRGTGRMAGRASTLDEQLLDRLPKRGSPSSGSDPGSEAHHGPRRLSWTSWFTA